MRGLNCPYEHSEDVFIPTPEMMFGFPPFPFPPGMADRGGRGGRGGRGARGGRGRGGAGGSDGGPGPRRGPADPSSEFFGSAKPPQDRNGNTLVITDIPPSYLSLPAIREYFSQFGEVTNVAVEAASKRALVSFTSNFEAFQAWKSDEAVFGSRHVKVLWHKPRPGQGGAGMDALAKSGTLVANLKAMQGQGGQAFQGGVKPQLSGPEQRLKATLEELENRERRQKKETLMAEQKVLLKRAQQGTKEEKLEFLKRLKEISKEIEEVDKAPPVTNAEGDVEMDEREKLNKRLEQHGMETQGTDDQDELMRLNAQLTALRDKVSCAVLPASRLLTLDRPILWESHLPAPLDSRLMAAPVVADGEGVAVEAEWSVDLCGWTTGLKPY
jgi:RNA-binding protein 26